MRVWLGSPKPNNSTHLRLPEFSPPQYGWGRLFFQKWFWRGPLRAGHGIHSSTEPMRVFLISESRSHSYQWISIRDLGMSRKEEDAESMLKLSFQISFAIMPDCERIGLGLPARNRKNKNKVLSSPRRIGKTAEILEKWLRIGVWG